MKQNKPISDANFSVQNEEDTKMQQTKVVEILGLETDELGTGQSTEKKLGVFHPVFKLL